MCLLIAHLQDVSPIPPSPWLARLPPRSLSDKENMGPPADPPLFQAPVAASQSRGVSETSDLKKKKKYETKSLKFKISVWELFFVCEKFENVLTYLGGSGYLSTEKWSSL